MPIQKCKPTSPGRRFVEKVVHDHLHKGAPYAPLVEAKKRTGGRNNNGERLPGSKYADVFNGFSYVAPLVMASYNKFNEIKSEHNTLASNQLASNTLNDQQPRSYRQMDDFYKKECARSIGLQQPMVSTKG